jgi:hypothetical protein
LQKGLVLNHARFKFKACMVGWRENNNGQHCDCFDVHAYQSRIASRQQKGQVTYGVPD